VDLITLTLGETYVFGIYDKGVLVSNSEFSFTSTDDDVITVDSDGVVSAVLQGTAAVDVIYNLDNTSFQQVFLIGAPTHDFQVVVKKPQSTPDIVLPPESSVVVKDTDNTHTTILALQNGITGFAKLMAGKVRFYTSQSVGYRFAVWKELYGKGRIVARTEVFPTWPAGQIITLVHPAIGMLYFQVGADPVIKGEDDLIIGDPDALSGLSFVPLSTNVVTNSSTDLEANWSDAYTYVPIDPDAPEPSEYPEFDALLVQGTDPYPPTGGGDPGGDPGGEDPFNPDPFDPFP
jgi:hypothetical protein